MDIISFVITKFSFAGFILAAIISSAFPMIPEEIFLLSLGYLSAQSDFVATSGLNVVGLAFFLIVGFLIVDTIIYSSARAGNKIAVRFSKIILGSWFSADDSFVKNHIRKIIFFSRFMVQIRFIGPFLAGAIKFPYRKFILIDVVALLIYVPLMLYLGSVFQNRVAQITSGVGVIGNIATIFILIVLLIVLARKLLSWFKKRYDGIPDEPGWFFGFRKKK